ncbi:mutator type transposase [Tanacetum coccineum]
MAQEKVIGDHTTQYSKLRQYVLELKERNLDTTVKIDVDRNYEPNSLTRKFRRMYVCLGALKSGFKAGQRDLLGLDGCFMSRPFPMQILTAVGVDPTNGIYLLAYAVVESETKQSWLLFLDCLGDDLELFKNSNFTFVTDKQKGIISALAETFPAAEHRVMEEVKQANKDVYDLLKDIPPQHWSRSHFSARPHCDVLLNNMCEVISKSTGSLTPKATKIFEFIKKQAAQYIISWNGGILYQATWSYIGDQLCGWNVEERVYSKYHVNPSTPTVNVNPSAQQNMSHSEPHVTVNPSAQSNVTHYAPVRFSKATASRLSPAKKTNSSGKRKVGE